jgi:hypothetical protein
MVSGATAFRAGGGHEISRALSSCEDNQTITKRGPQRSSRMTPADAGYLHTPTNTLSNELLGSTVIYDEARAITSRCAIEGQFLSAAMSRGSASICNFLMTGFSRGEHRIVSVDRSSAHGQLAAVGEIIAKHVANQPAASRECTMTSRVSFIRPSPSYTSMSSFAAHWI